MLSLSEVKIRRANELGKLSTKELVYYGKAEKFFRKHSPNEMIDIINQKSNISLRILDWTITTYSDNEKTKAKYDINMNGEKRTFCINIGYKAQLKSFNKKHFDPFRRKKHTLIYIPKSKNKYIEIDTTIGQLNFFTWALQYGVLDYVKNNYKIIVDAMNLYNKKIKKRKSSKKKTKPTTNITIKTKSVIKNHRKNIYITFD